jgi:3-hydroxyisobutyrate dehydrogenase-like beta-hydroxyacid dehydrogenase
MTAGQKLGWIGLGKMGAPICQRLMTAGYNVTAMVRNDAGERRASSFGIPSVRTTAELAAAATVVFTAVSDDAALDDLVFGTGDLGGLLTEGHKFIEGSTVSPAASARVALALEASRTPYIRAPFSGSTAMAAAGKLTILASGPQAVFESVAPMLQAYSARQFYLGEAEQARYMKLALNAMVGATSALVAETINYGRGGGLDLAEMVEVICNSAVSSPLIQYKREMLTSGDYAPAFTVSQMIKDLDLVLASGAPPELPMTSAVRTILDGARKQGDGELDFFVLTKQYARILG